MSKTKEEKQKAKELKAQPKEEKAQNKKKNKALKKDKKDKKQNKTKRTLRLFKRKKGKYDNDQIGQTTSTLKERYEQHKINKKEKKENEVGRVVKQTFPQKDFLVDNYPYSFSPSYGEHNGLHSAILQFYVRPGSNEGLTYEDVLDYIPISTLDDVKVHLINDDVIIKGDEKKRIIKRNAADNKETLENTDKEEGHKKTDDESAKDKRQAEYNDYDEYERIIEKPDPIVVFRWSLLVVGKYRESVEDQIEVINVALDQRREGATWDSLPGEQEARFSNLFGTIPKNRFELTATAYNYSGLNLAVNSGLNDAEGLPLGSNALSLYNSNVYFDFEHSTNKQAIISVPKSGSIPLYADADKDYDPSVSSMIAQYAANQFNMYGHRVHHIVLNDFDYFEDNRFYRDKVVKDIFKKYDVRNMTANPLEGFGHDINDAQQVYSRLIDKITNIFNLIRDLNMSPEERALVLDTVNNFYYSHGFWSDEAADKPKLSHIMDIDDQDIYPTMVKLLDDFTSVSSKAESKNRENKADRIDTLKSSLEQAMSEYTNVLARPTSIEPTTAAQVYYDFTKIETLRLRQIQLVNLIEYIIYTAEKDDVIIIHGFDLVLTDVADMILDAIQSAQKKGIRFIYCFDSIKSPSNAKGKLNDMFEMRQKYYTDLDTDIDWSMVGRLLPEEMPEFQKAINQELGQTVSSMLLNKRMNKIMIHRAVGSINDFALLQFII